MLLDEETEVLTCSGEQRLVGSPPIAPHSSDQIRRNTPTFLRAISLSRRTMDTPRIPPCFYRTLFSCTASTCFSSSLYHNMGFP